MKSMPKIYRYGVLCQVAKHTVSIKAGSWPDKMLNCCQIPSFEATKNGLLIVVQCLLRVLNEIMAGVYINRENDQQQTSFDTLHVLLVTVTWLHPYLLNMGTINRGIPHPPTSDNHFTQTFKAIQIHKMISFLSLTSWRSHIDYFWMMEHLFNR